ncbi:MAG TPA: hypothetical protein VFA11_18205 [Acidimicrobiales bacterium]|nr:hypothetical protein [Acidimicrobiales bacterium]
MILVMVAVVGGGMLAGRLHRQPGPVPTSAPTARGVHVIHGTVLAPGDGHGGCATAPAGVAAGASVVVVDQWGRTLAGSTLGSPSPLGDGSCSYPYQVPVPESAHYRIQVADLPPTDVTGTGLASQSWRVVQQDG